MRLCTNDVASHNQNTFALFNHTLPVAVEKLLLIYSNRYCLRCLHKIFFFRVSFLRVGKHLNSCVRFCLLQDTPAHYLHHFHPHQIFHKQRNHTKMVKNRIVTRVKDKTGLAKSKNRSEDLAKLREKHNQFSKNLKYLITTIQSNHDAMVAFSKSRLDVAKAINALTVDTPLFKCAGDIPASAIGTTDGGISGDVNPTSAAAAKAANKTNKTNKTNDNMSSSTAIVVAHDSDPISFAAVHLQLHKKTKLYHQKYVEHILTYAADWERILSTRVNKHLKHAEKLRVDLDHYQKKVEELNKDANKTMTKGKSVSDKGVDKLKRNEQKLVNARREHEQFVSDLCGFMEEIMERGWKDLHPLLVKMAQFDVTLSGEEASLLSKGMVIVVGELKALAGKHPNMNPTGRLKELETWSLESINKTNPKSESNLMITAGDEFGGGVTSADELDVGGGGLFGSAPNNRVPSMDNLNGNGDSFDWNNGIAPESNSLVHVASAPSLGYGLPPLPRQSNGVISPHNSNNSMMPILTTMRAAAPPPTLDDIFGAAPPPATSSSFNHNQPTGMPPPPPVMPPPPPPQSPPNVSSPMSMYNSSPMIQPPTVGMNQMSLGGGGHSNYRTMSSSGASASSSNPFDDQMPPPVPMMSGYQMHPIRVDSFGGGNQPAMNPPTNPFEM
jgi:hypothetical protein